MKDEKNKQQRQEPQENDMRQKKSSDHQMQGKQSSDQQPQGKQSSDQQSQGKHSPDHQPTAKHGQHPSGEDQSGTSQRKPGKAGMEQSMDVGEGDMRGDIENPDQQEQPGKKVNINDDPDQTRKKVPNAHK